MVRLVHPPQRYFETLACHEGVLGTILALLRNEPLCRVAELEVEGAFSCFQAAA